MSPNGPVPDESLAFSGHPAAAKLSPPPRMTPGWTSAFSGTMTAFAGPFPAPPMPAS